MLRLTFAHPINSCDQGIDDECMKKGEMGEGDTMLRQKIISSVSE